MSSRSGGRGRRRKRPNWNDNNQSPSKKQEICAPANYMEIIPAEILSHILDFLPRKDLASAALVNKEWYSEAQYHLEKKSQDICFVCDRTPSSRKFWSFLMKSFHEVLPNYDFNRYSFVCYGDHRSPYSIEYDYDRVVLFYDFGYNFKNTLDAIAMEDFLFNSDIPEAVMDGLYSGVQMDWRHNIAKRKIIMISDAPPHGTQYLPDDFTIDNFPGGCPCGIVESDIFPYLKIYDIQLCLIYFDEGDMNKTVARFKEYYPELISNYFKICKPKKNNVKPFSGLLENLLSI